MSDFQNDSTFNLAMLELKVMERTVERLRTIIIELKKQIAESRIDQK